MTFGALAVFLTLGLLLGFPSAAAGVRFHQRHRWMMRHWHWASLIREASTVYVVPDSDFMASDPYEGRRSRSSHFHVEAARATQATTRLE
jgi:hypothetical protein